MSFKRNTVRRVVTGVDNEGKSIVWLDDDVPDNALFSTPEHGREARVIWAIDRLPAPIKKKHDPMVDWFPDHEWFPKHGAHFVITTWEPGESYPMHASDTIDWIVIISGQIELILEKSSTVLGPGDCVVQRATQHGWRVVGDEPCTLAGVLVTMKEET